MPSVAVLDTILELALDHFVQCAVERIVDIFALALVVNYSSDTVQFFLDVLEDQWILLLNHVVLHLFLVLGHFVPVEDFVILIGFFHLGLDAEVIDRLDEDVDVHQESGVVSMLSDSVEDVVSTSLRPVDLHGFGGVLYSGHRVLGGLLSSVDDFSERISLGSSLPSFSEWVLDLTTKNGARPCFVEDEDVGLLLLEWFSVRLRFNHSSELPHLDFVLSHTGAATHFLFI